MATGRRKGYFYPSLTMIAAYIPGVYLGVLFRIHFLLDPKLFKLFVALVLLFICYRLLKSALTETVVDRKIRAAGKVKGELRVETIGLKKLTFSFWGGGAIQCRHSEPFQPLITRGCC